MRTLHHPRWRQRGVVLIFTLIILLILTIGAVALVRSMNTSLVSAGNLAFRRDLANQGEQAVSHVIAEFSPGGILAGSATTQADIPSSNYSAKMLGTNTQGVPTVLLGSDPAFTGTWTAGDLTGATPDVIVRYVIDRLCDAPGAPATVNCIQSSASSKPLDSLDTGALAPPSATVYRLTVRVSGPRSTQVFLQTTFTKPD
ncbi:MAG: pilus assembly protein [Pseudomonadota bacterium]|nr:pilus assembly protein [Pseudomonadota bacterium]